MLAQLESPRNLVIKSFSLLATGLTKQT